VNRDSWLTEEQRGKRGILQGANVNPNGCFPRVECEYHQRAQRSFAASVADARVTDEKLNSPRCLMLIELLGTCFEAS
jgi:hypothetical protein